MDTVINSRSNADISKIMKNNFFNNFQNIRDIELKFFNGIFHKGLYPLTSKFHDVLSKMVGFDF